MSSIYNLKSPLIRHVPWWSPCFQWLNPHVPLVTPLKPAVPVSLKLLNLTRIRANKPFYSRSSSLTQKASPDFSIIETLQLTRNKGQFQVNKPWFIHGLSMVYPHNFNICQLNEPRFLPVNRWPWAPWAAGGRSSVAGTWPRPCWSAGARVPSCSWQVVSRRPAALRVDDDRWIQHGDIIEVRTVIWL